MTDTAKLATNLATSLDRVQAASNTITSTTASLVEAISDGIKALNAGGRLQQVEALQPIFTKVAKVKGAFLADPASQKLFGDDARVVESIHLRCDADASLGICVLYEALPAWHKSKFLSGDQFQACPALHQPDILEAIIGGLGEVAATLEERAARITQIAESV